MLRLPCGLTACQIGDVPLKVLMRMLLTPLSRMPLGFPAQKKCRAALRYVPTRASIKAECQEIDAAVSWWSWGWQRRSGKKTPPYAHLEYLPGNWKLGALVKTEMPESENGVYGLRFGEETASSTQGRCRQSRKKNIESIPRLMKTRQTTKRGSWIPRTMVYTEAWQNIFRLYLFPPFPLLACFSTWILLLI